jgi:hypothetical protein
MARPTYDVYFSMIVMTLLALVVSSAFLYLDYRGYGAANPTSVPLIKNNR